MGCRKAPWFDGGSNKRRNLNAKRNKARGRASRQRLAGSRGGAPCRRPQTAKLPYRRALREGLNFKGVRWTALKEGRPCKRGPPLVRRPHKFACERAASTDYILSKHKQNFVSRSILRSDRKHRYPPCLGGFPVAPEPLRVRSRTKNVRSRGSLSVSGSAGDGRSWSALR